MKLCASSGLVGSIPMRFRHLIASPSVEDIGQCVARTRLGPGLALSSKQGFGSQPAEHARCAGYYQFQWLDDPNDLRLLQG